MLVDVDLSTLLTWHWSRFPLHRNPRDGRANDSGHCYLCLLCHTDEHSNCGKLFSLPVRTTSDFDGLLSVGKGLRY